MSREQLNDLLDELRTEVRRLDSDQQSRNHLNDLIANIEDEIDQPPTSIADNIQGHIQHFETEHPNITAVLNKIMVTLGNMGI